MPVNGSRSRAPEPALEPLTAAAQQAARTAGLSGAPRRTGRTIGRPVAGARRIEGPWYPKPKVAKHTTPYVVDAVDLVFSVAPWATVDGQQLVVRFETRNPTESAALYTGLRLEADPIAAPRYRYYEPEAPRRPGTKHEVRMDMADLLSKRKDVDGIGARGWGEVAWQIEVPFPDSGSTVLYDDRLAFRIAKDGWVATPTIVLGPFLHHVDEDSALLSFETDAPTVAVVGIDERVVAGSGTASTRHEIRVDGLDANTVYPYRVAVSDGAEASVSPPRTVTTPGPGPVTIAIASDSRSGVGPGMQAYNGVNAAVLSGLFVGAYRRGAQAVFFPGDLIDGYVAHVDDYTWQLRSWLKVVEGVHGHIPVYTGMGNHEALVDVWSDGVVLDKAGSQSAEAQFAALMANPKGAPPPENDQAPPYDETVYSVDIGPAHLVMLNTNYWYTRQFGHPRHEGKGNREGVLMEGQLQWLARDLADARARGVQDIVVMGHEPAFPVGGHTKDAMWWHGKIAEVNTMRERFWALLAEHEVIAYVSGDEHNYSRALIGPETVPAATRAVYSVISGGAGAPYYALDAPEQYADRVQKFSAEQHYTLWTFKTGAAPHLAVYGLTGGLIEEVTLDRR